MNKKTYFSILFLMLLSVMSFRMYIPKDNTYIPRTYTMNEIKNFVSEHQYLLFLKFLDENNFLVNGALSFDLYGCKISFVNVSFDAYPMFWAKISKEHTSTHNEFFYAAEMNSNKENKNKSDKINDFFRTLFYVNNNKVQLVFSIYSAPNAYLIAKVETRHIKPDSPPPELM